MMTPAARKRNFLKGNNLDLFDVVIKPVPVEVPDAEAVVATPLESPLPSRKCLREMFDEINMAHFEGKLPTVKIDYSNRMLGAGLYYPLRKEIKIGVKYHQIFPDEIEDTLKHEMIHIIHPQHDRAFKTMARRLGASLKARPHLDLRRRFKYLYCCPKCGKEYPRRKRLRMASCGVCSKGCKFDPQFKLILRRSTDKGT